MVYWKKDGASLGSDEMMRGEEKMSEVSQEVVPTSLVKGEIRCNGLLEQMLGIVVIWSSICRAGGRRRDFLKLVGCRVVGGGVQIVGDRLRELAEK